MVRVQANAINTAPYLEGCAGSMGNRAALQYPAHPELKTRGKGRQDQLPLGIVETSRAASRPVCAFPVRASKGCDLPKFLQARGDHVTDKSAFHSQELLRNSRVDKGGLRTYYEIAYR